MADLGNARVVVANDVVAEDPQSRGGNADIIIILGLPTDHPIAVPSTHGTDFTPVGDNHESRYWLRERSYRPSTSFSAHLRNLATERPMPAAPFRTQGDILAYRAQLAPVTL